MEFNACQNINLRLDVILMLCRAKLGVSDVTYDDLCDLVNIIRSDCYNDLCREFPEYKPAPVTL
jgi:hypothetical protein